MFKKETKGGVTISKKYEKCDLISHHTARRTFVTLYLKHGGSSSNIGSLAGMSAVTVMKYDKRSKLDIANEAKTNGFFARENSPVIGG